MYISPKDVFDNGLLQLSGETSCLFTTSTRQATKPACCLLLLFFINAFQQFCGSGGEYEDFFLEGLNEKEGEGVNFWRESGQGFIEIEIINFTSRTLFDLLFTAD